jgi:hypothetical protein
LNERNLVDSSPAWTGSPIESPLGTTWAGSPIESPLGTTWTRPPVERPLSTTWTASSVESSLAPAWSATSVESSLARSILSIQAPLVRDITRVLRKLIFRLSLLLQIALFIRFGHDQIRNRFHDGLPLEEGWNEVGCGERITTLMDDHILSCVLRQQLVMVTGLEQFWYYSLHLPAKESPG